MVISVNIYMKKLRFVGMTKIMIAGGAEAAVCKLGVAGFCAARSLSTKFNDLQPNIRYIFKMVLILRLNK